MHKEVERAITTMWDRYGDPLTLSDLARSAILSKFYFSRVFRSATGTTPGRFLSAIRLHRAKNFLLSSSLSVTDISYQVGYNSTGTFTSRFTRSVGLSPTRYRMHAQHDAAPPVPLTDVEAGPDTCTIRGSVQLPRHLPPDLRPCRIHIGTFGGPLAEGVPTSHTVVDRPGGFLLTGVPTGSWYVIAIAVATDGLDPRPWRRGPIAVGSCPVVAGRPGGLIDVAIGMHEPSLLDAPVLLALPELDTLPVGRLVSAGTGASRFVGARRPPGPDFSQACGAVPEGAPIPASCAERPAERERVRPGNIGEGP